MSYRFFIEVNLRLELRILDYKSRVITDLTNRPNATFAPQLRWCCKLPYELPTSPSYDTEGFIVKEELPCLRPSTFEGLYLYTYKKHLTRYFICNCTDCRNRTYINSFGDCRVTVTLNRICYLFFVGVRIAALSTFFLISS